MYTKFVALLRDRRFRQVKTITLEEILSSPPVKLDREKNIDRLQTEEFDVLIIGGGASGAGAAVDAASRELKTALIEREDFSAGTSSRSSKMPHGGVRYLEQAIKTLNFGILKLVYEALHERRHFFKNASHLAEPMALVTPCYHWFQLFYLAFGLKIYEWLAGRDGLPGSRMLSRDQILERYPMINPHRLKGGVQYYDGRFDDSRMNLALAVTAHEKGAAVANHLTVLSFHKDNGGNITGAQVRDELTSKTFSIKAKTCINATGPFCDTVRKLDDVNCTPLLALSSGAHIVLDSHFPAPKAGILIPKTADGRVLFILPFRNHTLIGTTDNPAELSQNPKATEEEVSFILNQAAPYYRNPPHHQNVIAKWSGLRPLVSNPEALGTASLSRDHTLLVSPSGLVSITGGKWTTYRLMAKDAVDKALSTSQVFSQYECHTDHLVLVGAKKFTKELSAFLQKEYQLPHDTAHYLSHAYGDQAPHILKFLSEQPGKLHPQYPFLDAEVLFNTRYESARTIIDVLARRIRIGFIDQKATQTILEKTGKLMASELMWSPAQLETQIQNAKNYFT